jgi:hypothetical protein
MCARTNPKMFGFSQCLMHISSTKIESLSRNFHVAIYCLIFLHNKVDGMNACARSAQFPLLERLWHRSHGQGGPMLVRVSAQFLLMERPCHSLRVKRDQMRTRTPLPWPNHASNSLWQSDATAFVGDFTQTVF